MISGMRTLIAITRIQRALAGAKPTLLAPEITRRSNLDWMRRGFPT